MSKLEEVIQSGQRERFQNMSDVDKEKFLLSLQTEDGFSEEQAKRAYGLFETGLVGSVAEALKYMRDEEEEDKHPYTRH